MENFIHYDFHERTNRQKSIIPKAHTKHWRDQCDAYLVHTGEKCKNCGNIEIKGILKKDMV